MPTTVVIGEPKTLVHSDCRSGGVLTPIRLVAPAALIGAILVAMPLSGTMLPDNAAKSVVLLFEFPKPLSISAFQAAVAITPAVVGRFGHPQRTTDRGNVSSFCQQMISQTEFGHYLPRTMSVRRRHHRWCPPE